MYASTTAFHWKCFFVVVPFYTNFQDIDARHFLENFR